jgi:pimeloyl-ACP methyl ester carboxylesterase
VPENRRREDSRPIELAFVRIEGTAGKDAPPLIYLHGGPGGLAIGAAREMARIWAELLPLGDVVLLDQRGCGGSKPNLTRAPAAPPPPEIFASRAALSAYLARAAREVADALRQEGVDVTGYDTEQNADDVDDLRRALGARKMRLLGFSYGSHLGLSVLRRHGEHVDRAILIGVEGPNETCKLPSQYDTHVRKLTHLVARDPVVGPKVPDFAALLRDALARVEREPIAVTVQGPAGQSVAVPVGRDGLLLILQWDFGDTSDLVVFPRLLWEVARGDGTTLRWFVAKRYRQMAALPVLLLTMDPASGCTADRAARIAEEAEWSLAGNAAGFDFPEARDVFSMPTLPAAFRRPVVSSVPTLFVSGSLDVNTPPYQAEHARWGFADSAHLVQEHGGHEDWMRNPALLSALRAFLAGEKVTGRAVDMAPLRFVPIEGPATDVAHPSVAR